MKNGKILIIDDNEDVLFALNLLLEPYVEQIKVTTQPERIEHFMSTFVLLARKDKSRRSRCSGSFYYGVCRYGKGCACY